MIINRSDCRYMDGYKPCRFHKASKRPCEICTDYKNAGVRILIIKIGAAGDVIRHTPILHRLRQLNPDAVITWVTNFPELVPETYVDRIYRYNWESQIFLSAEKFDILFCLDKESAPCVLANQVKADIKKGFCYSDLGKIIPFDDDSFRKWRTGIDDTEMHKNTMHYVEEVFEICGYKWSGEEYILPKYDKVKLLGTNKRVAGIQTGAGGLWQTRIPHFNKLDEIIESLLQNNYEIILLGGPDEDHKNVQMQQKYGLYYFGVRSLNEFINIIDNCDVVITPVTMSLHIAIGLKKHVVLLNNIFNRNEFHLYGKGIIIEPRLDCLGCYKKIFDTNCPVADCTLLYETDKIMEYLSSIIAGIKK